MVLSTLRIIPKTAPPILGISVMGLTSIATNPSHTYTTSGVYTVTLNASNACGSAVLQLEVNVMIVGTETPTWVESLIVMPNPAYTSFDVLMVAAPVQEVQMTLFDLLGREIKRQTSDFSIGSTRLGFDVSDLQPATYFLRINHGSEWRLYQLLWQNS